MMKMMMAVMCLALVGSATATTCDATSIASCQTSAASGLTSCSGYQTYINCWGSCGVNSTFCASGGAVDTWVASVNAALSALGGGCTLTNPCTSSTPTPTPAVTTTVQSQKVDLTLPSGTTFDGATKTTYECGYWNTISTKAGASNYCSGITGTGCTTTNSTTNGTTTSTTTCTGTTNTYVTGLSSVGSSYSSSRRGAGVTFTGNTLSSLISAAALATASGFSATEFTNALAAAFSAAGITYTAPTGISVGTATQTASAGTIAPVFGLAAAALFAVINY